MKLIKGIYRFIDKKIILPITRFFILILSKIKKLDISLESILVTKSISIIFSLILAVLMFIFVDKKGSLSIENSAEVLYNQKVEALYNNEEYVIEGLPETVDITMIGSKSNLYLAKQLSNQTVSVVLSDLKTGTHQVNIKYKQAISNVEYKLDPSTVTVTISNKQSLSKEITNETLNLDTLDTKYSISNISLYNTSESLNEENLDAKEIGTVIVKGKEDKIKEVAIVKALIDINNISSTQIKEGNNTVKNVPLVAYNNEIMDVELVPSVVNAIVNLESNSKEVPINVVVKNIDDIVFGKAIEEINPSVSKVTIYGNSEALETVNKIDVTIDVANLKSDKTFTLAIKKPDGIRKISSKTVNVEVKIGDQATTEIAGVKISYKNLGSDYVVQATQDSTTEVPVIVTGVDKVIKNISSNDIDAYVDLKGLTEGEQTVKVVATGNDSRVTYKSKIKEIKLVIIKK